MTAKEAYTIWTDAIAALNEAKANYDAANALYVAASVAKAKAAAVVTARTKTKATALVAKVLANS